MFAAGLIWTYERALRSKGVKYRRKKNVYGSAAYLGIMLAFSYVVLLAVAE